MNYDNTKIKNLNVLYALYCLYIKLIQTIMFGERGFLSVCSSIIFFFLFTEGNNVKKV